MHETEYKILVDLERLLVDCRVAVEIGTNVYDQLNKMQGGISTALTIIKDRKDYLFNKGDI